jgi:hypothetical protein
MELVISIQQPNYMPWLGYFHKIKLSDTFVFLDTVDIQTRSSYSLTNRAHIKTKQGVQWLTVPIRKGQSRKIKDILIDNVQPWKQKQLNTLFHAYNKAPFFEEVYHGLEKLFSNDFEKLADLNIACIAYICEHFQIGSDMKRASEIPVDENDKNNRLISICKALRGDVYLSGEGGKKYNNESLFLLNKVQLKYINFSVPEYHQLYGKFVNGLSVIDAFFNCGDNAKQLI